MKFSLKERIILFVIAIFILMFLVFVSAGGAQGADSFDLSIKQVKSADSPTVYYLNHEIGRASCRERV